MDSQDAYEAGTGPAERAGHHDEDGLARPRRNRRAAGLRLAVIRGGLAHDGPHSAALWPLVLGGPVREARSRADCAEANLAQGRNRCVDRPRWRDGWNQRCSLGRARLSSVQTTILSGARTRSAGVRVLYVPADIAGWPAVVRARENAANWDRGLQPRQATPRTGPPRLSLISCKWIIDRSA